MAAPKTANINVTVGSTEYIVNHSNFSQLVINRTAKDVNDTFDLSILDNDAYEIEGALLNGNNYIQIDYIDNDLKVYKNLGGYIFKMSSSFINNRNMLTLHGLVSTSIRDKYQKYSFSWNVVPKFDWGDVLGEALTDVKDANYEVDSGLDRFGQRLLSFLGKSAVGLYALATWNWSSISNYKDIINTIFDKNLISIDMQGNYYIKKYKRDGSDYSSDKQMKDTISSDDEEDNIVKSNGSYTIPIKPHKLLKLICCGGKFSDLLEKEYTDYKGTAFYSDDINDAEWCYIKKWYEKMGSFEGLGYGKFENKYETVWDEHEYVQTKQSYMEFMYNTVLSYCVCEKNGKKYTNFYLSFDQGSGNDKGKVTLSRIDASYQPQSKDIPQYIYYGRFKDEEDNNGRMISFSPSLDIMTAMITGNTVAASKDADISDTNLAGSDNSAELVVSASNRAVANEGRYNVNWGMVKVTTATNISSNKEIAEKDILDTFNEAAKQSYKAEAVIEGFNTLTPQSYIEITLIPKNETGSPTKHHMSGTYFILSIEDTIADGKFTSKLKLIKNIDNIGSTAQVEEVETADVGALKYTVKTNYTNINSSDSALVNNVKSGTSKNITY